MINFSFLIAFLVALVMTGIIRRYAIKHSVLDIPNARSSHDLPMPRGGGLAIVAPFLIGLVIAWICDIIQKDIFFALFGAGGAVVVVGLLDDHGHVAQYRRLIIHFIASFWALWWLEEAPTLQLFGYLFQGGILSIVISSVFLVWLLNLFNFMDGIDSIAGSEAIYIAICGAIFTWLTGSIDLAFIFILLAVTTLGFLIWNWPPAKIFMGDVGSGFLGITLGILSYAGALGGVSIWSWLILFGVFLVDATFTLISRFIRRERWYEAHRSHAYQWSARRWGHLRVSIAVNLINLFWLLPLAYYAYIYPKSGLAIIFVALLPLVILAYLLGAGRLEVKND